jgi:ribosome maturation factor RimP
MISQLEVEIHREAERVALAQGVELYWLEVRTSGPRWQVVVYIDHAGGVTIDDCERVSRALEGPLDALIDHSYELEVSSPGIDRPLHTRAHYQKALGKPVELRLRERTVVQGWLHGLTESTILLADDHGETVPIAFDDVRSARVIESRFL